MANVRIASDKLDGVTPDEMGRRKIRPGYEHANVHMVFEINVDDRFTTNSRLMADGHTTAPPSSTKYSSVVSRESIRIEFLLTPSNGFEIFACDIGDSYLNAKCREKLWIEVCT